MTPQLFTIQEQYGQGLTDPGQRAAAPAIPFGSAAFVIPGRDLFELIPFGRVDMFILGPEPSPVYHVV
jgi:hypothetical protein